MQTWLLENINFVPNPIRENIVQGGGVGGERILEYMYTSSPLNVILDRKPSVIIR